VCIQNHAINFEDDASNLGSLLVHLRFWTLGLKFTASHSFMAIVILKTISSS
jgi:hypothetical protein